LRTLTVIRDTLSFIAEDGKQAPDLERLPFDDPAVYRMIASGIPTGCFSWNPAACGSSWPAQTRLL
jgi:DNA polymerase-3 subunit alpha